MATPSRKEPNMLGAAITVLIGAIGVNPSQYQSKTIVVDLSSQQIVCMEKGQFVYVEKVSTGNTAKGFHTIEGTFTVGEKWHKITTTRYSPNIDLYWVIRVRGNYLIHQRPSASDERLLGQPASHGCVRVSKKFAPKLYAWASRGTGIIIQK